MPKNQKFEFHILYFKSDICDIFAKTIAFITIFHLFVESAREARRLLAIMCIGILANHHLCKHPQNQLVRVYQCLITTFQKLFLCS